MLFISREILAGVGDLIAAAGSGEAKVELTETSLTVSFSLEDKEQGLRPAKASKAKKAKKTAKPEKPAKPTKSAKKDRKGKKRPHERFYEGKPTSYWAGKLGLTPSGVLYRIDKYGNPYGAKGPSDKDKVIAGS